MAYGNGTNAPFGLKSTFTNTSATFSGQQMNFSIANAYATSLFSGDPVAFVGNGVIGICPTGTPAIGVFAGCTFTDTLGNYNTQPYWPASQATLGSVGGTATVITDPSVLYDIQVSNSQNVANPTITAAMIGKYANFAVGAGGANLVPQNPTTGNTRSGLSAYYLDVNSISDDPNLSLYITGFTPYIGNAPSIPFNNVLVTLNNQLLNSTTTGTNLNSRPITVISDPTASYTLVASDSIIEVSNSNARAVTITLPAATTPFTKGQTYTIKDTGNAGTNNITIQSVSAIDLASPATISARFGKVTVYSDGVQWWTV